MKLNSIFITLFLLSISSENLFSQTQNPIYTINGFDIEIIGHLNGFSLDWKTEKVEEGLEIATITLDHAKGAIPSQLSLKWAVPSNNIAGYWSSSAFLDKTISPDWGPTQVKSMLSRHSPVISLFGHNDINRQTFAVSEALSTVITSTSVKEENGMMYNEIKLFTEKHKKLKTYQIQFRLDTRSIPFSESLTDVASWWASFDLYTPSKVPEAAKLPVYSSWYSYHQNVTKDALIEECKLAKSIGFESIIVDDGWQTLDSNRGYAYTGDWKPERIPEMKSFVSAVHELDMKFILWYAVPFVGEKSQAYKQMKGKFLDYWESQGTYVVDPRFPEVRKFIINTYIKAVNEWDLDGFKLDFLGRFRAGKNTRLVADEGRDYASINDATDRLMTDLMTSLRAIKPDIMIEFRQPYTGPAMRKYGNMLRASDCPNVALINRVGTTDLRLLSGNTAVHADMLMWHNSESVENAALQLLNVIFSVPQISVKLADIPEDHFEMIRFYTDYWLKNRAILLEGTFIPSSPLMNYPILSADSNEKRITAIYNDLFIPVTTSTIKKIDVINAKSSKRIILDVTGEKQSYKYIIFDCKGKETANKIIEFDKDGVYAFNVPPSGLISLIPIK
ncbi:glycoside hydrolase family 36 protein [Aureibaculum luteum]|uniref:glycoside hydrolase family 36 protein n=1 Tax=Aureibaculum luteum TaxID=1548456 RepID=UPI000E4C0198|nr:glycoside hydrolase family 36 protein [Aureibaculum luteum]